MPWPASHGHAAATNSPSGALLLVAHRAYAEPGNGAALSMATLLHWLADAGFAVGAVTSGLIEQAPGLSIAQHHDRLGFARHAASPRPVAIGQDGAVAVTSVETNPQPDPAGAAQFAALATQIVQAWAPTHLLTYGADPCVEPALEAGRALGAEIVTVIHAGGYTDRAYFRHTDRVLTHSGFMATYFRDAIGLRSTVLPPPMDWRGVVAPDRAPEFVTFINPAHRKGVIPFAALAIRLARERPDIPLLVVASGASADPLALVPALAQHPALLVCPPRDPRDIYAVTKLLLVPTVVSEPFGRVAAEAMMNGIPPLVSDRGGLPEAAGAGGLVLPLPLWLAGATDRLPTDAEMAPWFNAITRLWDDPGAYAAASAAAYQASDAMYNEAAQRRRYAEYFTDPGPFPPLFP